MPDPTTPGSGKSKNLPNFYSAVGGMDKYAGGQASAKSPAQSAADSGEKVKNVTTLLEVIKKMDAQESDPENKKILEQVASLVEQYMTKLQPGTAGEGKGKTTGAAAGGGADSGPGGGPGGGSGATVGDTTAASSAM